MGLEHPTISNNGNTASNNLFIIISLPKSTHHQLYKQKTPTNVGLDGDFIKLLISN